jgi:hypothetical protein
MTSSRRSLRVLVLPLVVLAALALPSLAAAAPLQKVFNLTEDEQTWTVPTGVDSIAVEAIGAGGKNGQEGSLGGRGAIVKGTLAVTPGEVLYVEVGAPIGTAFGTFNGGGGARFGGNGGGASDVRTVARSEGGASLASRLLIAGGGGGGGGENGGTGGDAGAPGTNGGDGLNSAHGGQAGGAATATGGGSGGAGGSGDSSSGVDGGNGGEALGGSATSANINGGGGGGGGGLYGGGAGGTGGRDSVGSNAGGGGGGGGSNLVPSGGSEELAARGTAPKVTFTYSIDPVVQLGGSAGISPEAAILLGAVSSNGEEVSGWFEYGPTTAYGSRTPTFSAPQNVNPSVVVGGLTAGTTYHYRLVGTSASEGRTVSADATFSTLAAAPPSTVTTITLTNPTAPTVPLAPGPVVTCKVPKLTGKSLPAAKRALVAADCALGKVTKRKGPAASKGKVVGQGKKPGTVLADGAAVTVVVGR